MGIRLSDILDLVGKLDDTPGEDTPRERFRRYLGQNLHGAGEIRDYVEECLRNSGEQYSRALQDLINYVGRFLGFDVTFGRYRGVQGEVGFDGYWRSPADFHIVVEVKTTETYSVKTAVLVDYVNRLISDRRIPSWDKALGLYVIGRPDPDIRQLENAIVAEKRTDQLRIISVNSLLSLAEMMQDYDVRHEDILEVLRPSGPAIDKIVDLMSRLVLRSPEGPEEGPALPTEPIPEEGEAVYWLTPVAGDQDQTPDETVETLVGQERVYAFGDRTPGRSRLKPGDWICFYAVGKGVVAHARVASAPKKARHPKIHNPERYPWVFDLTDVRLYLDNPVLLDAETRARLEAFRGRDPVRNWAWFVQATRRISEHDFLVLVRR